MQRKEKKRKEKKEFSRFFSFQIHSAGMKPHLVSYLSGEIDTDFPQSGLEIDLF